MAKSAAEAESNEGRKPKKPLPKGRAKQLDPLEERVRAATEWTSKNRRNLVAGAVIVAIALGSWTGWTLYSEGQSEAAGKLLASALEIATARVRTPDPTAEDDVVGRSFRTYKQRALAAQRAFGRVLAQYPGSDVAPRAQLGVAAALYDLHKYAQAEQAYSRALAMARNNQDQLDVAAAALEGLGFCLEARGLPADALRRYQELARLGGDAYRDVAEYHQARIAIAQNHRDRAVTLLRAVQGRLQRPPREGEDTVDPSTAHPYLSLQVQAFLEDLNAAEPGSGGGPSSQEDLIRRLQQLTGGRVQLPSGLPGARGAPSKRTTH